MSRAGGRDSDIMIGFFSCIGLLSAGAMHFSLNFFTNKKNPAVDYYMCSIVIRQRG
jgi:hypothetical protein